MQTKLTIVVEDAHTDNLGHLNHVAAVRILEQARYECSVLVGCTQEVLAATTQ